MLEEAQLKARAWLAEQEEYARQETERVMGNIARHRAALAAERGEALEDWQANGRQPYAMGAQEPPETPDDAVEAEPPSEASEAPTDVETPIRTRPRRFLDTLELLHEPEPDHVWVIPGVLERGDRVILTGGEGDGKTTLCRQLGMQAAIGVHPFTLESIERRRTLLMDLENPRRLVRRKLWELHLAAHKTLEPGWLTVATIPQGIDLANELHRDYLSGVLDKIGPELVIAGPLYKMSSGDPTEEGPARATALWWDTMRERLGFALVLEAHQPHAVAGSRRVERPYGASLWLRWPEFGLHLARDGTLHHWRGDRDERDWPLMLSRGGEWPWVAVTDARGVTFARMLEAMQEAGHELTTRELAGLLGCSAMTVSRAIKANEAMWRAAVDNLGKSV